MAKIKPPVNGTANFYYKKRGVEKNNKLNMDKVKIKRVKRNKKKITTKEKILAGIGMGGSLLGAVGNLPKTQSTPPTAIVSTQQNENGSNKKSASDKIKDFIADVFGIKKAKAASSDFGGGGGGGGGDGGGDGGDGGGYFASDSGDTGGGDISTTDDTPPPVVDTPPADVTPPVDVTPPTDVAPPADVTPPVDVTPPTEVAPPADVTPPVDVTPPTDVAPPADVTPPVDVTPPTDVAPPADVTPPVDVTPPTDVAPPADVTPPVDVTPPTDVAPPADPIETIPSPVPTTLPTDLNPITVNGQNTGYFTASDGNFYTVSNGTYVSVPASVALNAEAQLVALQQAQTQQNVGPLPDASQAGPGYGAIAWNNSNTLTDPGGNPIASINSATGQISSIGLESQDQTFGPLQSTTNSGQGSQTTQQTSGGGSSATTAVDPATQAAINTLAGLGIDANSIGNNVYMVTFDDGTEQAVNAGDLSALATSEIQTQADEQAQEVTEAQDAANAVQAAADAQTALANVGNPQVDQNGNPVRNIAEPDGALPVNPAAVQNTKLYVDERGGSVHQTLIDGQWVDTPENGDIFVQSSGDKYVYQDGNFVPSNENPEAPDFWNIASGLATIPTSGSNTPAQPVAPAVTSPAPLASAAQPGVDPQQELQDDQQAAGITPATTPPPAAPAPSVTSPAPSTAIDLSDLPTIPSPAVSALNNIITSLPQDTSSPVTPPAQTTDTNPMISYNGSAILNGDQIPVVVSKDSDGTIHIMSNNQDITVQFSNPTGVYNEIANNNDAVSTGQQTTPAGTDTTPGTAVVNAQVSDYTLPGSLAPVVPTSLYTSVPMSNGQPSGYVTDGNGNYYYQDEDGRGYTPVSQSDVNQAVSSGVAFGSADVSSSTSDSGTSNQSSGGNASASGAITFDDGSTLNPTASKNVYQDPSDGELWLQSGKGKNVVYTDTGIALSDLDPNSAAGIPPVAGMTALGATTQNGVNYYTYYDKNGTVYISDGSENVTAANLAPTGVSVNTANPGPSTVTQTPSKLMQGANTVLSTLSNPFKAASNALSGGNASASGAITFDDGSTLNPTASKNVYQDPSDGELWLQSGKGKNVVYTDTGIALSDLDPNSAAGIPPVAGMTALGATTQNGVNYYTYYDKNGTVYISDGSENVTAANLAPTGVSVNTANPGPSTVTQTPSKLMQGANTVLSTLSNPFKAASNALSGGNASASGAITFDDGSTLNPTASKNVYQDPSDGELWLQSGKGKNVVYTDTGIALSDLDPNSAAGIPPVAGMTALGATTQNGVNYYTYYDKNGTVYISDGSENVTAANLAPTGVSVNTANPGPSTVTQTPSKLMQGANTVLSTLSNPFKAASNALSGGNASASGAITFDDGSTLNPTASKNVYQDPSDGELWLQSGKGKNVVYTDTGIALSDLDPNSAAGIPPVAGMTALGATTQNGVNYYTYYDKNGTVYISDGSENVTAANLAPTGVSVNTANPGPSTVTQTPSKLMQGANTVLSTLSNPFKAASNALSGGNASASGAITFDDGSTLNPTASKNVYQDPSDGELWLQSGKGKNVVYTDTGIALSDLDPNSAAGIPPVAGMTALGATTQNGVNYYTYYDKNGTVYISDGSENVTAANLAPTGVSVNTANPGPSTVTQTPSKLMQGANTVLSTLSNPFKISKDAQVNPDIGANGAVSAGSINPNNYTVVSDLDPNATDTTSGAVNYYFVDSQGNKITDPVTIAKIAAAKEDANDFVTDAALANQAGSQELNEILSDNQVHSNFDASGNSTPGFVGNLAAVTSLDNSLNAQTGITGDLVAGSGGTTTGYHMDYQNVQQWVNSVNQNGVAQNGQVFFDFMTQQIPVTDVNGDPTGQYQQLATVSYDESGSPTVTLNNSLVQAPSQDGNSEGGLYVGIPNADTLPHEYGHVVNAANWNQAVDNYNQLGQNVQALEAVNLYANGYDLSSNSTLIDESLAKATNPDAVPLISALQNPSQNQTADDLAKAIYNYTGLNTVPTTLADGTVQLHLTSPNGNVNQWATVTMPADNSPVYITQYNNISPAAGLNYVLASDSNGNQSISEISADGGVSINGNDITSLALNVKEVGQVYIHDGQIFGADNKTVMTSDSPSLQTLLQSATSFTVMENNNGTDVAVNVDTQNKSWTYQIGGQTCVNGPGLETFAKILTPGGSDLYFQSAQNGQTILTQVDVSGNKTGVVITENAGGGIGVTDNAGNSVTVNSDGTSSTTGSVINPNVVVKYLQNFQQTLASSQTQAQSGTSAAQPGN